jgi:hypothetical protein
MFKRSTQLVLGVFLGFTSLVAQAQTGFKPGYVVRPAGDTLRGELQVRSALRSSLQCRFRPATDAPAVDYLPSELRAYAYANGARYETQTVLLPDTTRGAHETPFFLEVLVSGRASLYVRRDGFDETRYYLRMAQAAPGPVLELEKRVVRAVNISQVDQFLPVYRKTLSDAFRDCFAIQSQLTNLDFSSGSLIGIVRRYNAYVEPPTTVAKPDAKSRQARFSGGVAGGVTNASTQFLGSISLHNGTFKANAVPVYGVFASSTLPFLNENLQLRLDVLYESMSYDNTYVSHDVSTVDVREHAVFNFQSLRFPLQLRYTFRTGYLRPFLFGGFVADYLLSNSGELRAEYTAGGAPIVNITPTINKDYLTKYEIGFLGGAGVTTSGIKGHAVGIEARAERTSGYVGSTYVNLSAPIIRFSALLSIALF